MPITLVVLTSSGVVFHRIAGNRAQGTSGATYSRAYFPAKFYSASAISSPYTFATFFSYETAKMCYKVTCESCGKTTWQVHHCLAPNTIAPLIFGQLINILVLLLNLCCPVYLISAFLLQRSCVSVLAALNNGCTF